MESQGIHDNQAEERPITILLVDDDAAIRESVADILSLHNYMVLTADDGSTALPLLDEHLPDVIISDIMMQEMSGYDLFDAVRSNPQWGAIPFIFLTARGQQSDIEIGQRMGADAYLTKPFEPEELLLAIENRVTRVRQITSITEADVARMKQEIITLFSHELRTPLTYIVGYANLLEEHRNIDPTSIDDMVAGIERGAARLVKLVEDLMLMVRIDSGVIGTEIAERRMSCRASLLISEVVRQHKVEADQNNVQINIDIRDDVTVPCLPMYVEDALSRLVSNAVKFCKRDGGDVTIRAEQAEDMLLLTVDDNGIGIKPGQQRILFERFRQINREMMEQQGIGLGLTIARSLVRLHSGDITVRSVPGEGSTFTISLPLNGTGSSAPEYDVQGEPVGVM